MSSRVVQDPPMINEGVSGSYVEAEQPKGETVAHLIAVLLAEKLNSYLFDVNVWFSVVVGALVCLLLAKAYFGRKSKKRRSRSRSLRCYSRDSSDSSDSAGELTGSSDSSGETVVSSDSSAETMASSDSESYYGYNQVDEKKKNRHKKKRRRGRRG